MLSVLRKAKRPLLALSMVLLGGTGVASAYDTCSSCPQARPVYRPAPVVTYSPVYYSAPARVVRTRTVYRSAPVRRVVYQPVYYSPVTVCDPCTPVIVETCDPCGPTVIRNVYPAVTGTRIVR